jgi:hypothetical protein
VDVGAWVRDQGVVLQSARGPVPNVAELVAGEPIRGSWWAHPAAHRIYAVLGELLASGEVAATRLVNGKVTLVHRRLWPALARLADRFPDDRLASVDDEHTATGAHRRVSTPFPDWMPVKDREAGARLTEEAAAEQLRACLR